MGVYIKGMEMPKYFQQAEVGLDADGNGVLLVYPEGGNEPNVYSIVPVPDHGRLIDADEAISSMPDVPYKGSVKRVMMQLPTVIPAEEGE